MKIKTNSLIYMIMVIYLSVYAFTRGGIGLMVSTTTWTLGLLVVLGLSMLCICKKSLFVISKRDVPIILMIIGNSSME